MFVPVKPPPGMLLNGTEYDAMGRWRIGNLIRFFRQTPQPVGGWTSLLLTIRDIDANPTARDTLDGTCRGLLTWRDNEEQRWMALGTTKALYVHDGSELFDITPDGMLPGDENTNLGSGFGAYYYDVDEYGTVRQQPLISLVTEPGAWSFSTWGQELIASPNWNGIIYKWAPGDAKATIIDSGTPGEVPGANRSCMVSNERHLIAIGAGDWGGALFDKNSRRIAWSTSEDYTEWVPSLTNSAGDLELQTKGIAMCGDKFKNEILIWTDIDVHRMAYIGSPFYYNLQRLSPSSGIASINAKVVTAEFVFWVGPQGFYIYDGAVRELVPEVSDFYRDDVNREEFGKLCCGHNPAFNEVWVFYPSKGNAEIDSYVIWNYEENTWSVGRLARSAWNQASIWGNPVATLPIRLEAEIVSNNIVENFLHGQWKRLAETTRLLANIVVKSDDGLITYTEGVDYDEWMELGVIRTLATGTIPNADDLSISYEQVQQGYSKVYNHEDGMTDDGLSRDIWLDLAPIEVGAGDQLAVVKRIMQDTGREDDLDPLLNSDAVQISFTTRLAPEAVASQEGPYVLDPVRGYTDVRFTAREVTMRFNQVKDELWRIGKYRLDIMPGSGR